MTLRALLSSLDKALASSSLSFIGNSTLLDWQRSSPDLEVNGIATVLSEQRDREIFPGFKNGSPPVHGIDKCADGTRADRYEHRC